MISADHPGRRISFLEEFLINPGLATQDISNFQEKIKSPPLLTCRQGFFSRNVGSSDKALCSPAFVQAT